MPLVRDSNRNSWKWEEPYYGDSDTEMEDESAWRREVEGWKSPFDRHYHPEIGEYGRYNPDKDMWFDGANLEWYPMSQMSLREDGSGGYFVSVPRAIRKILLNTKQENKAMRVTEIPGVKTKPKKVESVQNKYGLADGFYWFRNDLAGDGDLSVVEITSSEKRVEYYRSSGDKQNRDAQVAFGGAAGLYGSSIERLLTQGYIVGGPIGEPVETEEERESRLRQLLALEDPGFGIFNAAKAKAGARLVELLDARAARTTA